jgi:transcriptional regulator with XRE-family HTH domain
MFSLNDKWGRSMIAIDEKKVPSPAELAEIVRRLREQNKWSQAALAASARVHERTIQRVENAEGSNHQTRRALARAFGFKDYDIFEKPFPPPSDKKNRVFTELGIPDVGEVLHEFEQSNAQFQARAEQTRARLSASMDAFIDKLEQHTELIPITLIRNGCTLRSTMLEQSIVHTTKEFGDHTPAAREAFAKLADYLDDYRNIAHAKVKNISTRTKIDDYLNDPRNIAHEYSATERIRIDADLDTLLAKISEQHCAVGAGLRRINLPLGPNLVSSEVGIIVLAQEAAFPVNIRAPRLPDPDTLSGERER